MKRWLKLAVLVLAVLVTADVVSRVRRGASSKGREAAGATAPDFSLPDLDGAKVRLSDLRGRVVVVNFWATWCPPCKEEIPAFAALYAARGDACVEFLGVAEDSGPSAEVRAAAQEWGINYPVLLDDGRVSEAYGAAGYPWTVVVDAGGKIRSVFQGLVERQELEGALAPLLAETGAGCAR